MLRESQKLLEIIKSAKKVAIFAHKSIDPDSIGSIFAAKEFCKALKVDADVFAVCEKDFYVSELFPVEEIKTEFNSKDYNLIILTDCHSIGRIDSCFQGVENFNNIVIVDHHAVSPEEGQINSKLSIIKPEYAAASEIWAELFIENKIKMNEKTATYLYCGLMGDTDRFLHKNLTKHVFEIAQFLLQNGAEIQKVYDIMYRQETRKQINLKNIFYNKIEYVNNGAFVIYTMKDYKKYNIGFEDVKMFSNDMIRIEGVKVSIFVYQVSKNIFKFSIRTNGLDARKFAVKMGGGGHVCASAFEKNISLNELKKMLPVWIKEILND